MSCQYDKCTEKPCQFYISPWAGFKSWGEWLSKCKGLTKEEAETYNESLAKVFKPTGRNIFD